MDKHTCLSLLFMFFFFFRLPGEKKKKLTRSQKLKFEIIYTEWSIRSSLWIILYFDNNLQSKSFSLFNIFYCIFLQNFLKYKKKKLFCKYKDFWPFYKLHIVHKAMHFFSFNLLPAFLPLRIVHFFFFQLSFLFTSLSNWCSRRSR